MTLQTARLTKEQLPAVHFGSVHSVGEVYTQFIRPLLPMADVVQHWHTLLMEYVRQPGAILFIRRYASATKTEYHKLRRGFLTLDPTGFGYAYCDNYFPQLIFAQVLAGHKPTLAAFNAAIESRNFPVAVRLTKNETAQLTFGRTAAPPLGARGWKLSHLYSVNQGYSFDYESTCKVIFPRGEYDWWGTNDRIHQLPTAITEDFRAKMVAHFLRAVHPANYFLSPAKKHQVFAGKDVGESPVLLAYVQARFRELYGSILEELEPLLLPHTDSWREVAANEALELTIQESVSGTSDNSLTKPRSQKPRRSTQPTRAPYPITFSTAANAAATAQQFKQELLLHKKATLTRCFKDGAADVPTPWDARNMTVNSNLHSNIRGRFRGTKAEVIAAIHAAIAYD